MTLTVCCVILRNYFSNGLLIEITPAQNRYVELSLEEEKQKILLKKCRKSAWQSTRHGSLKSRKILRVFNASELEKVNSDDRLKLEEEKKSHQTRQDCLTSLRQMIEERLASSQALRNIS